MWCRLDIPESLQHLHQSVSVVHQSCPKQSMCMCINSTATISIFAIEILFNNIDITKTRLFKYIENFTIKKWKFSDKKILIFFIFLLKT